MATAAGVPRSPSGSKSCAGVIGSHAGEEQPVAQEDRAEGQPLRERARVDREQRHHAVAQADALEHAGDAVLGAVEQQVGDRVQHQAQADEAHRAQQHRVVRQAVAGERHGHADHEEEEREDQVGGRASVPGRVAQRRVHVAPVAGIVHEQHRRDR